MVKIRVFKDFDAPRVSKLIRKTLMSSNSKEYPLSLLKPLHDYFTPGKVKILALERYCLIAESGGKIVGTGAFDEDEIKTVFVDPTFQGQGTGKKIMVKLEQKARKEGVRELLVASSLTGVSFYEKLGFKKVRSLMSKHAGRQVQMRKKLS